MILKAKYCYTYEEIVRFVNELKLTKNDIQQILTVEDHFVLFYWDKQIL